MISFQCPKCRATHKTADEKAGLRTKCPKCGCPVQIPKKVDAIDDAVAEVLPAGSSSGTISAKLPSAKPSEPSKQSGSGRSRHVQSQEESLAKTKRKWPLIALAGCSIVLFVSCSGVGLVAVVFRDLFQLAERVADNLPQQAAREADFTQVDIRLIQNAYRSNEAAADATYLNKKVQFEFRPLRVDKEPNGYCVEWH